MRLFLGAFSFGVLGCLSLLASEWLEAWLAFLCLYLCGRLIESRGRIRDLECALSDAPAMGTRPDPWAHHRCTCWDDDDDPGCPAHGSGAD